MRDNNDNTSSGCQLEDEHRGAPNSRVCRELACHNRCCGGARDCTASGLSQLAITVARYTARWAGLLSRGSGAFTGECSAASLLALGCQFGIVGHSERRQRHGETDGVVAAKAQQLEAVALTPIICVGESSQEREAGETFAVIERQVRAAVQGLRKAPVIAYEPIWAIGTGMAAEASDADAVQQAIAKVLKSIFDNEGDGRVLYGGSVKPENTADFMSKQGIDGLLVGGASLTAESFMDICHNAGR